MSFIETDSWLCLSIHTLFKLPVQLEVEFCRSSNILFGAVKKSLCFFLTILYVGISV